MFQSKRTRTFWASAAILLGLICQAQASPLEVYAAASLTDAFKQIGAAYARTHPGQSVEFNFAGSQVLRTQIEQGAPADIFASADTLQMGKAQAAGLVGEPHDFAHNVLVVAATTKNRKVMKLADLASPGIRLVTAAPTVPAGRYGATVLKNLNGLLGSSFSTRVNQNVLSQESNVRAVLVKVELGEADAGIVYRTDALSSKSHVRVMMIPTAANVLAVYPIAPVKASKNPADAAAFISFVLGKQGRAILHQNGFQK